MPERPFYDSKALVAVGVLLIYFVMLSVSAYGSVQGFVGYSIVGGHPGNLLSVGTGPIIFTSFLVLLLIGLGILKLKGDSAEERARFERRYRISVVVVALVLSALYGPVYTLSRGWLGALVGLQFLLASFALVLLDRYAFRNSFTAGINLLIVGGVIYAVAFRFILLLADAINGIRAGGLPALPSGVIQILPVVVAILIFWASLLVYKRLDLQVGFARKLSSRVGGFLPISVFFVTLFGLMITSSILQVAYSIGSAALISQTSNIAKFFATYQPGVGSYPPVLVGGIVYLLQPSFPLPYPSPAGIGGYWPYITYLATAKTSLFLPWGGSNNFVLVPEVVHIIVYVLVVILLTVGITKLWVKALAKRLNINEELKDREWIVGSAAIAFLYALGGVLGTGGGYVTAAAVLYVLSIEHGVDLQPARFLKRLALGWFSP